jgi:hypothetical protein
MSATLDWMMARNWPAPEVRPRRAKPAAPSSLTKAEEAESGWEDEVVERLIQLLRFPENWDSYGARRPQMQAANELLAVLYAVMQRNTPAPSVVPAAQGHFQAEWHRNGIDLEVEVASPTSIFMWSCDGVVELEEELDFDLSPLVSVIKRLGRVP